MKNEKGNVVRLREEEIEPPLADNTPALHVYRAANERYRRVPWPAPSSGTYKCQSSGSIPF